MPFHKYLGPGTHISSNIHNDIVPINRLDAAALIHDVEYLAANITEDAADKNAYVNAGFVGQIPFRLGFNIKDLFGGYKNKTDHLEYIRLKHEALSQPKINAALRYYGCKFL